MYAIRSYYEREFCGKPFQNACRIKRKPILTQSFCLLQLYNDEIEQRVFKIQPPARELQRLPAERKMRVPQRERKRNKSYNFV